MKIEFNNNKYFVSAHKIKTDTNYNISVRISKNTKDNWIYGWHEKEETDNYNILIMAIKGIKRFEEPEELF